MDERNRFEFGALYDRLCAAFNTTPVKEAKALAYEALSEIDFPSVRSALRILASERTRKEGMPTPGDIRAEAFRQAAAAPKRSGWERQHGLVSPAEASKLVAELKKRLKGQHWSPQTDSERRAASLFHDLLHYWDDSLTPRPACPPMGQIEAAVVGEFGGPEGFRSLTAESVLEGREMFCRKLAERLDASA